MNTNNKISASEQKRKNPVHPTCDDNWTISFKNRGTTDQVIIYAIVTNMDSTSNLHKKTLCITQGSDIILKSHNLDFCKLAILIIVVQSSHWHHSCKYATWTTQNWNESKQQANCTILEKKEHDIWISTENSYMILVIKLTQAITDSWIS